MSAEQRINQRKRQLAEEQTRLRTERREKEVATALSIIQKREEYDLRGTNDPSIVDRDIQKTRQAMDDPELEALLRSLSSYIGDKALNLPPFRLDKKYPAAALDRKPYERSLGSIQIYSLDLLLHFGTMNLETSVRVDLHEIPMMQRRFETLEELKNQIADALALIELRKTLPSRGEALGLQTL